MTSTLACLVGDHPCGSFRAQSPGARGRKKGGSQSNILLFYQHGDASRLELIWELWRVRKKGKGEVSQQQETKQGATRAERQQERK